MEMRAIVLREFGGPGVLRVGEFETPKPGPGEVLVRVKAVGVNRLDIWIRSGKYRIRPPHIPGTDVAGVVEEVGRNVGNIDVGERVVVYPLESCGSCEYCLKGEESMCINSKLLGRHMNGGYAEYVKVRADMVFRIPEKVGFKDAAAIPVNFLTSWHMLFNRTKLSPGDRILVIGGGSGIGYAAIELAKLAGASVIATVGEDWKIEKAKSIGADYVVNRRREDVYEAVMKITDGEGVDIVFEHAGKDVWPTALKVLKRGGTLVFAGATSGDEVNVSIRQLYWNQLNLHGSFLGNKDEFRKILKLLAEGRIKPIIDSVYRLEDASEAHRKMEASKHFGKLVLEP